MGIDVGTFGAMGVRACGSSRVFDGRHLTGTGSATARETEQRSFAAKVFIFFWGYSSFPCHLSGIPRRGTGDFCTKKRGDGVGRARTDDQRKEGIFGEQASISASASANSLWRRGLAGSFSVRRVLLWTMGVKGRKIRAEGYLAVGFCNRFVF